MAAGQQEFRIVITADGKAAIKAFDEVKAKAGGMAGTLSGQFSAISSSVSSLALRMTPLIAIITAVAGAMKHTADKGEEFRKLSMQVGMSVEQISALKFASDIADSSFESLIKGAGILSKGLAKANEESGGVNHAMKALGIGSRDATGALRPTHDILLDIAERFEGMKDGLGKTALAMLLFGKSGKELIPILNEGRVGIEKLEKEAASLGVVMSGQTAKAADDFNDNLKRMEARASGLAKTIAGPLLTAANDLFDLFGGKKGAEMEMGRLEKTIAKEKEILDAKGDPKNNLIASVTGYKINYEAVEKSYKEHLDRLAFLRDTYFTHKEKGRLGEKSEAPEISDPAKLAEAAAARVKSMMTAKEQELAIVKSSESLKNAEYAAAAQTGKMTAEDLYNSRQKLLLESYYKEIQIDNDLLKLTQDYYDKKKAAAKLTGTKEEQAAAQATLAQEELTSLQALHAKMTMAAQGYAAERTKNEASELERRKTLTTSILAAEHKLVETQNEEIVQATEALYARELDALENAKARGYITEQAFARSQSDLLKRQMNDSIALEDKKFEVFKKYKTEQIMLENRTPDENRKVWEEIEIEEAAHFNRREQIAADGQLRIDQASRIAIDDFSSGWDEVMRKYVKSAEWGFDKGKSLANDAANSMSKGFDDMLFGRFKEGMQGIVAFFKRWLLEMVNTAAINPIVIPIVQGIKGAAGGYSSGGFSGLLNTSLGGVATLGGAGAAAGIGYGAGGYAGSAGALGGYMLGSSSSVIFGAAQAMGASQILGIGLTSIMPIVGTVFGLALGKILGGLFSKKEHTGQIALYKYGPGIGDPDPSWTSYAKDKSSGAWGFASKKSGDWTKTADTTIAQLEEADKRLKDAMSDMGMDISHFAEGFWKDMGDVKKMTPEQLSAAIKDWTTAYFEQVTGGQFKKWQKAGEEITQTADRIYAAFKTFPGVMRSFSAYISAIQDSYDSYAQLTDQMNAYDEKISQLKTSVKEAKDPADQLKAGNELKQAIFERYQAEITFVKNLRSSVEQLGAAIRQTEHTMAQFYMNMQLKINDLQGKSSTSFISETMYKDWHWQYGKAKGPEEKLNLIQYGTSLVDAWLQAGIADIEKKYKAMADAEQSRIDTRRAAIQAEVDGLNRQLQVIQGWQSLLDNVTKTISDLTKGSANPDDIYARMSLAQDEIQRVKGLYTGSAGESRLKYAGQLQELLPSFLSMSQEGYQRPSPEYMQIYRQTLADMQSIQADASAYVNEAKDIQGRIEALQAESNALSKTQVDYTAQMNAEIQALKNEAAANYQWLQQQGMAAYQEQLDAKVSDRQHQQDLLNSIVGPFGVDGWITQKQQAAVDELKALKATLKAGFEAAFPGVTVPAFASGAYVTKPTIALIGEKGPEYVIPAGKMASAGKVEFNLNVTVSGDASPQEVAAALIELVEDEMKYGKLGKVAVERVKNG